MGKITTSFIRTSGASTDTRTRDQLSRTFTARPQAMTVYVRFQVRNNDFAVNKFYLQVGSLTTTTPRLLLDHASTFRVLHQNSGGNVNSTVSASSVLLGDIVELRGVLNANGSVLLGMARNGGSETVGSTSAAKPLATAWAQQNVILNSAGTLAVNFCAYTHIRIVRRVRDLQYMRKLAGVQA